MILNNYQALQELMRRLDEDLSESLLTTLHATLTRGTLRSPEAEGRLRTTDDIVVQDGVTGEIVHVPPSHRVIRERLERLYRFANGTSTNEFVDPVVKASMLHYWLAYEHPFEDGNGRTARMLLYWSLLRDGYWLVELLSISQQIKRAATQYYRAFEHVATDEFDLTYFIANDIRAIRKALDAWRKYFETRRAEMRELQDRLQAMHGLNHRQRTLVAHALRHPSNVYTVQSHARSQQVADPTARSDLKELVDRGYLRILRSGRPVEYAPVPDLEARLRGSGRRTRRTAASRRRNPGGR
jgi:Fic family protein